MTSTNPIRLTICLAIVAASCGSESSDNGSGPGVPDAGAPDTATQDVAEAGDAQPDSPASTLPTLGVVAIPPAYDGSEAGFGKIVDAALQARVDLISFGYAQWGAIEKSPGSFDFSEFDGWLAAIDQQPFIYAMDVSTPIAPFGLDMPEDLAGAAFDDPVLRSRYGAFLEASLAFAPEGTRYITLHVEGATEYFAENPSHRDGFCGFMSEAVDVIHAARPDLLVGVYWRYEDRDESLRDCAAASADYLGLAFVLNPPGDGLDDVPAILDWYLESTSQPVAIVEAGWPSATRFSSSEEIQAEFVNVLFEAVSARRDRIPFVSYYTVYDEDRDIATAWVGQLFPDLPEEMRQELVDWVCSLGLLRADGTEKPSWTAFAIGTDAD